MEQGRRFEIENQIRDEKIKQLETLIADIKYALNTEEDGTALVEVACQAEEARQDLASRIKSQREY